MERSDTQATDDIMAALIGDDNDEELQVCARAVGCLQSMRTHRVPRELCWLRLIGLERGRGLLGVSIVAAADKNDP